LTISVLGFLGLWWEVGLFVGGWGGTDEVEGLVDECCTCGCVRVWWERDEQNGKANGQMRVLGQAASCVWTTGKEGRVDEDM